ncbi:protein tyrosine phosphatase [Candidatus Thermokryptus mobilis]|uniref:Protein tyrosine phosphatase n=1 Tax=Candidatus Thermokryptus mobilis TaxID=1643428 RepID=A0A0S4N6A5_9BACT|nr:arsenate reductase ArsC [Candidatus Thermokryptus mobilis]CUU06740.1 protein tyrosine phosphatase [Candidatus Thermokryptus mobilis]
MIRVLFLCTGNSCRSQMAEGLLRHFGNDKFEVYSAGTNPSFVHPLAIEAMREIGIDISWHRSKSVMEFIGQNFDYVITVCDKAKESCPTFPGDVKRIHWSFEDPAEATGTKEERMKVFRKVREQIKEHILSFIKEVAMKREEENASGD